MKKALVLYPHGIGDIIQLTPYLRKLYNDGYIVDIMCMDIVKNSKLLDGCPYIDKQIVVPNNWKSPLGFDRQIKETMSKFNKLSWKYDWSGASCHLGIGSTNKIDFTGRELNLEINDRTVEVFIPKDVEKNVLNYINTVYSFGYIYAHTFIAEHTYHNWDAREWIKNNLLKLPIVDSGYKGNYYMWTEDINATFVLAREAKHRIISSSVMVHACDAMGVVIDVVNYGRPDRKVWPDNYEQKIIHIREDGKWIK